MAVPPRHDVRWRLALRGNEVVVFNALPTKLLFIRLRLVATNEARLPEAIDQAYEYFVKNEKSAAADLAQIIALRPS